MFVTGHSLQTVELVSSIFCHFHAFLGIWSVGRICQLCKIGIEFRTSSGIRCFLEWSVHMSPICRGSLFDCQKDLGRSPLSHFREEDAKCGPTTAIESRTLGAWWSHQDSKAFSFQLGVNTLCIEENPRNFDWRLIWNNTWTLLHCFAFWLYCNSCQVSCLSRVPTVSPSTSQNLKQHLWCHELCAQRFRVLYDFNICWSIIMLI